jgi:hypothetical protein
MFLVFSQLNCGLQSWQTDALFAESDTDLDGLVDDADICRMILQQDESRYQHQESSQEHDYGSSASVHHRMQRRSSEDEHSIYSSPAEDFRDNNNGVSVESNVMSMQRDIVYGIKSKQRRKWSPR